MSTNTRAVLSKNSKYYIPKHRYYELRHFCQQYPDRGKEIIERACDETDPVIGKYILTGIVKGYSYDVLRARTDIPCCRDSYYELYRKFFYILNDLRE